MAATPRIAAIVIPLVAAGGGVVSTVLAVSCTVPYIRSILDGRTRPHQFSWLVFTIMNGIVTVSQFLAGGRASVLISLTFLLGSAVNFVLSLRFGTRDSSPFDRLLLGLSLGTIVAWTITKSNATAIWLTVLIDVCATTMILLKVRNDPSSEARGPWVVGMAAYVFAGVALADSPLGILYVRPIYGLLGGAAVVGCITHYARGSSPLRC